MAYIQTKNPEFVGETYNINTVWARVRRIIFQLADRRAIYGDLKKLSERKMKDIGLTQADVHSVSSTPLSVDAAKELSIRAKSQSNNWLFRI